MNQQGTARKGSWVWIVIALIALGVATFILQKSTQDDDGSGKSTQAGLSADDDAAIVGNGNAMATTTTVNGVTTSSSSSVPATTTPASTTTTSIVMKPTPSFSSTETHGAWTFNGTDRLVENPAVSDWMDQLKDPAPEMWQTFPNVQNDLVDEFEVSSGMEYGTYDSPFCYTDPCDFIVGAWEYRYYTGPYAFEGFECGIVGSDQGCMLLVINVMDQSYTFRDNHFDNGFTLRGRYFDGDALDWGVWGLVSHGSANMLNMPTMAHPGEVLNSGNPGNSGANCGSPLGCQVVHVRVLVYAGDALISDLETTVTR